MKKETIRKSMSELSPLIEGLVSSGTDVTVTVTGNSMRPMLRHLRDSVVLTKCDPDKLKKGDLPLYKRADGSFVLHRIVRVNDGTFDMCGDRQSEIEVGVPKQNVIAVTKSFTRRGRNFSCDNAFYKAYVSFWCFVLPLRRSIFSLWAKVWKKK